MSKTRLELRSRKKRMPGRALALLMAVAPAAALANPPTLDALYRLPVKDAASIALGPGPEEFVERSPWNAIEPNYVLNSIHLFGMSFFTRPERIGASVCAVTLGSVTFDTAPTPGASADEKAAEKLPYGQRPLRWVRVDRSRRYFAAGPAPAVPLIPGAKPKAPSEAALTPESCENPVSARNIFDAPSPEAAISAVTQLKAAISAAKGRSHLFFALTIRCDNGGRPCADARARLAALKPQALWAVRTKPCPEVDAAATDCVTLQVDDETLGGGEARSDQDRLEHPFGPNGEYWDVTIATGSDGKLRAVHLWDKCPPVP
ncbi:MAG TPA: hypothetical protein VHR45_01810 [Thermoanaerobaculia bacterium]|nr:hypothetical protein [Thermoanaerobaculia bacterium]